MMNRIHHRLRVLHVSFCLDIGGQEKLLVEFARHADRSQFTLHFVSLTSPGRLGDGIAELGWPVTALNEPDGLRPGLILRLLRCYQEIRPDIVHTHDDRPLIYGGAAGWLARKPVIHSKHYGRLPSLTWRRGALLKLAARWPERFVCVSRESAGLAIAQGVPASKVSTIWNGIDLERYAFTGPDPKGPVVTVARLSPEKDLANLLRAVALLVPSEPDFRLEIAGDGPERERLHRLAAELHLQDHVRFLGERDDVPALLARARFFVLPSLMEGISLTLLEAMARGLAVVATRAGGNAEVVVDGDTGLLVPTHHAAELASAIRLLWRNPGQAEQFGRAGRCRAEAHFDIRHMVGQYQDLYRQTMEIRNGRISAPASLAPEKKWEKALARTKAHFDLP